MQNREDKKNVKNLRGKESQLDNLFSDLRKNEPSEESLLRWQEAVAQELSIPKKSFQINKIQIQLIAASIVSFLLGVVVTEMFNQRRMDPDQAFLKNNFQNNATIEYVFTKID